MANTVATSALGFVYWVVVARLYRPTDLARNAALISAMLTLSGICQLNMGLGLGALLPRAGRRARRMLSEVYFAVTVFAIGVLAVFLLGVLPRIASLHDAATGTSTAAPFVAAVLLYNVFALQDAALAALRAPTLVPVENTLFGVAKIVVVVALATKAPRSGIFLSWAAPLAFLVLPISGYLFARVAPRQSTEPVGEIRLIAAARPVAIDYLAYLFLLCSTVALPAFAVALLGPHLGAIFAVAYLTSSSLDLLGTNMGVALTVEVSHAHERRTALLRRTLTRGLPLMATLSAAGIIAAPLILELYGPRYAASGVLLLRLLLAGAVPRAVAVFAVSQARAQRHMGFIVRTQFLTCALIIGGAVVLTPSLGLTGIGVAWLGAQLIACLTVIPRLVSPPTTPGRVRSALRE
ncbi:MAG TPA: hypothetical protein VK701_05220 [Solirubrobacteraceae bacterium]|jgi:O-antigen/teichoic acid export membrane protein|nr:hypothetical protein [Solirubrobacteraceae bacterium]